MEDEKKIMLMKLKILVNFFLMLLGCIHIMLSILRYGGERGVSMFAAMVIFCRHLLAVLFLDRL